MYSLRFTSQLHKRLLPITIRHHRRRATDGLADSIAPVQRTMPTAKVRSALPASRFGGRRRRRGSPCSSLLLSPLRTKSTNSSGWYQWISFEDERDQLKSTTTRTRERSVLTSIYLFVDSAVLSVLQVSDQHEIDRRREFCS